MKKSGFTLMELVVYIAMIGIVVLIAGEAFSNSTKFRVRTQNMLKASEEAANVAAIFRDDVSQMGAKSSKEESAMATADVFYVANVDKIYMDPFNADKSQADSSSFLIENDSALTFRRMRYDHDGSFVSIEEVSWYVENETLYRTCKVLEKSPGYSFAADDPCSKSDDPEAVEMATGVERFQVLPGLPIIRTNAASADFKTVQMFPPEGTEEFDFAGRYGETDYLMTQIGKGGKSVKISGFTTNYDAESGEIVAGGKKVNQIFATTNTGSAASWKQQCAQDDNHFTFIPGVLYEISFELEALNDEMRTFVPGRDHMAVGFRLVNGKRPAAIDDFMFYPPTGDESTAARKMRFTVPDTVKNACLAFTFASYSPMMAKGSMNIGHLTLKRVAQFGYEFDATKELKVADKQNVKALQLSLIINRRNETGNDSIIVPVPSNGPRD